MTEGDFILSAQILAGGAVCLVLSPGNRYMLAGGIWMIAVGVAGFAWAVFGG